MGEGWFGWRGISLTDRAELMGLCVPGLITDAALGEGLGAAWTVLALEGLAEAFHQLPFPGALLDQPARLLDAFAVIREARGMQQIRDLKAQAAARAASPR